MKKKLLAVTLAAGMLAGLAVPVSAAEDPITLRMAWWGSQARHDATVKVIEMYEKMNPNIDIEYEFYSSEDYFTKLKTLVASDQVWDIFQLGGNFPEYMDKIHPVNEFIDAGIIDTSKIAEANLQTTQDFDGTQLGISNGLNGYGIAYDVDMFKDAGLELPTDTWTWDDFKEAALAISENTGDFGVSDFLASEFIAGCSVYTTQHGDLGQYSFFNLALDGMGFDDPSLLEGYIQLKADLVAAGAAPDAGAAAEITNIENDFLVTGEAGMTWVAVNQFPTIYDICKEEGRTLGLVALPRITSDGPSGIALQSSQMLCVSEDSEHQEEAAKFINWFENDVECNKVLNGERGIPINSDVLAALSENASEGQTIMYEYMDRVGKFETPEKVNVLSPAGQDEVVDKYRNYIWQVAEGELTAAEAAQKTYDDASALFN